MNVIVEPVVEGTKQLVRLTAGDTAIELTLPQAHILIDDLDDASVELFPCECGHGLIEQGEWCARCTDARDGLL